MARLAVIALVVAVAGCAGTSKVPVGPRVSSADLEYLRSPLEGYPRSVDPASRSALDGAALDLRQGGAPSSAREVASELLRREPQLDAAMVLRAQAALVEGDYDDVVTEMQAVTRRVEGYSAALLLLGRAAESTDRMALAHRAYREVEAQDEVARSAAERTRSPALEALQSEVEQALESGRVSEASMAFDGMMEIDPEADPSLRAALSVGSATGDRAIELEAARKLSERYPGDFELAHRRAALEVESGDPGTGLRILQELAEVSPDDPQLVEELARARFRWRLALLPDDIQAIARREQISRAEFASMLYWLVPSVRYGAAGGGRIATDILDHPRKEEIIRVVNQGLLGVDPGLHAFSPEAPLTRFDGLKALLRLMATGETPAACLGGFSLGPAPSTERVCGAASGCGLIGADAECLPGATVDGDWVVEAARQALNRLGI